MCYLLFCRTKKVHNVTRLKLCVSQYTDLLKLVLYISLTLLHNLPQVSQSTYYVTVECNKIVNQLVSQSQSTCNVVTFVAEWPKDVVVFLHKLSVVASQSALIPWP